MEQRAASEFTPSRAATGAAGAPQEALSLSTVRALRRLLHAFRDGWLVEARLADAARMIAEDAHRDGLRAEQMVIAIKDVWSELPEVRGSAQVVDVQRLLSQLVTRCIHEFYEPSERAARDVG